MDSDQQKQGHFASRASALGKAERTRARLLDAAVTLFSRDGFGRATAFDIAAEAGVANGTFYTYFKDRDHIARAVAVGMAEIVAARMAQALPPSEDARMRVAYATIRFVSELGGNAEWVQLFLQALAADRGLRQGNAGFIRADLELGVVQGHFAGPVDDILVDAVGALALAALTIGSPESSAERVAALQLVMLGVGHGDAAAIAASAAQTVRQGRSQTEPKA